MNGDTPPELTSNFLAGVTVGLRQVPELKADQEPQTLT